MYVIKLPAVIGWSLLQQQLNSICVMLDSFVHVQNTNLWLQQKQSQQNHRSVAWSSMVIVESQCHMFCVAFLQMCSGCWMLMTLHSRTTPCTGENSESVWLRTWLTTRCMCALVSYCVTRALRERRPPRGQIGPDLEAISGVQIRIQTPDPDLGYRWLPKFNGDFHVQRYIYGQIFMKIRLVRQRYEPNCRKMPYIAVLKNPSKNSSIQIRKLMTYKIWSVLPCPHTSVVTFFVKMHSVVFGWSGTPFITSHLPDLAV